MVYKPSPIPRIQYLLFSSCREFCRSLYINSPELNILTENTTTTSRTQLIQNKRRTNIPFNKTTLVKITTNSGEHVVLITRIKATLKFRPIVRTIKTNSCVQHKTFLIKERVKSFPSCFHYTRTITVVKPRYKDSCLAPFLVSPCLTPSL